MLKYHILLFIIMNPIYYLDCYQKEFESVVKKVSGKYVVLEQTAFYPTSGGQPNDTGKLNDYNVVYVAKHEGDISHEVDKEGLKVGDKVKGVIDWDRRYTLMRYHTAAHILAHVIEKQTGAICQGNNLSLDKCRIDFNVEDYDPEQIKSWIDETNKLIKEGREVILKVVSFEVAKELLGDKLSMSAKGMREDIEKVRLVEIKDFVNEACGGTHVKDISEIKGIEFLKSQNKGKNNRRIYFKLVNDSM